jgi:hypothetical protein
VLRLACLGYGLIEDDVARCQRFLLPISRKECMSTIEFITFNVSLRACDASRSRVQLP